MNLLAPPLSPPILMKNPSNRKDLVPMKVPLRYWLTYECWLIALGGYLGVALSYYLYSRLLNLPSSLVWFLIGFGGTVLVPTLALGYYQTFRGRYIWRISQSQILQAGLTAVVRLMLTWFAGLVPMYFIFGTYVDFFVKHQPKQAVVFAILLLLTSVGWLWLARRIFRPLRNMQPPDPTRPIPATRMVFRSAMKLLGLAALGVCCLAAGIHFIVASHPVLAVSSFVLAIAVLFLSDRSAKLALKQLNIDVRWVRPGHRDNFLISESGPASPN